MDPLALDVRPPVFACSLDPSLGPPQASSAQRLPSWLTEKAQGQGGPRPGAGDEDSRAEAPRLKLSAQPHCRLAWLRGRPMACPVSTRLWTRSPPRRAGRRRDAARGRGRAAGRAPCSQDTLLATRARGRARGLRGVRAPRSHGQGRGGRSGAEAKASYPAGPAALTRTLALASQTMG